MNFKAERRANETTGALPGRYRPLLTRYQLALPLWFRHHFQCISDDDPLGVGGDRGRVVAQKLVVSAPFRVVSDDPLGVGGVSWR